MFKFLAQQQRESFSHKVHHLLFGFSTGDVNRNKPYVKSARIVSRKIMAANVNHPTSTQVSMKFLEVAGKRKRKCSSHTS